MMTLEPTIMKDHYHETLREITAHHKGNLLQLIGVDPIVFRTESSRGEVDLQIWVTTITGTPLNRVILPFYFVGARKYIFMCSSKNAHNFVNEALEITQDKLNAAYEIVILTPKIDDEKAYARMKTKFRKIFRGKSLVNFSFHQWANQNDIAALLTNLVEDIVVNIPRAMPYIPVGFDLSTVEDIAKKQGFEVNETHEVLFRRDDIVFRVNLQNNDIHAEISECTGCEEKCKAVKKLCIEVANKGYATLKGLGDLRILSILFAIKDGSIMNIKGTKPQEDISQQIEILRKTYAKKCKKKT
jgi:hypothetical protein